MESSPARWHISIQNIRLQSSRPGLKPQHLVLIGFFQHATRAHVSGAQLGSTSLYFAPTRMREPSAYTLNSQTAASIPLMLQAVLPFLLFYPWQLTFVGGTDVNFSPNLQFFASLMSFMGFQLTWIIHQRGIYPRGLGRVQLQPFPSQQRPRGFDLVRPGNEQVSTQIWLGRFGQAPPMDWKSTFVPWTLQEEVFPKIKGSLYSIYGARKSETGGLWTVSKVGTDGLRMVQEAKRELMQVVDSGACVDEHVADNLVIYMALAKESSRVCIPLHRHSKHLEAMLYTVGLLTGASMELHPPQDQTQFLTCCPSKLSVHEL